MICPECGKYGRPDPETGYDADDFCSAECEEKALNRIQEERIVCHFSCGAASAVATKLILKDHNPKNVFILNAFIKEEHPDNRRFLSDCERWFGKAVIVLRDEKFGASTHEVWKKKRFFANGMWGAPCSKALKRDVLDEWSEPSDVFVLGYTADPKDQARAERFMDANPERKALFPLIERNLTHEACLAIIERAGIELPEMYRKGYHNANCIGCCKGGEGYWNKIKVDFPSEFNLIADIQESIGPGAYIFRDRDTNERYSLRQMKEGAGKYEEEPDAECSLFCIAAAEEIT